MKCKLVTTTGGCTLYTVVVLLMSALQLCQLYNHSPLALNCKSDTTWLVMLKTLHVVTEQQLQKHCQ